MGQIKHTMLFLAQRLSICTFCSVSEHTHTHTEEHVRDNPTKMETAIIWLDDGTLVILSIFYASIKVSLISTDAFIMKTLKYYFYQNIEFIFKKIF